MEIGVGLLAAGVFGALIGAAVTYTWRYSERRQVEVPAEPAPLLPPGAEAVLSALSSSSVVLDASEEVVRASAPAVALGIVTEGRVRDETILTLVRQVQRDGQAREVDLDLQPVRGTTAHVHLRVGSLTSRLTLVLAQDQTRERRVEAIRRDFVANVSHELKTPVGAVGLLAEAVLEAKDDPAAVERFAERMQYESERLTRLVQQIIDLARLQNDQASDAATVVKVDELVSEACEPSSTEAESKRIEIACDVQPGLMVHGDRSQLHAAVSNLVENAVTYSPEGSRVAVTVSRADTTVRITVADHGIGIPEHEVERIFERFYRVDPARARTTGGTGLGLSIVKHVAASNHGTVEVWSEPGAGSTFTLVLPEHRPEMEEESA